MLKKGECPHAAMLAALVAIRHVALASLNSSGNAAAEPRLNHWLALALECASEGDDAPCNLKSWLDRARGDDAGAGRDEAVLNQVDSFQATLHRLLSDGMDAALDWVADEFKPLIAWSEDDELVISSQPPPLLRSSPLGLYVRRSCLTLSRMELDEIQEWWLDFERWIDGVRRGKQKAVEQDAPIEFAYSKARLQQDYHRARELVRAFPSHAGGSNATRTSQQALLHLALVEYEDGGYGAARQALVEATRIARTVGDVACLAACRSLEHRLVSASPGRIPPDDLLDGTTDRKRPDDPHDLLWDLERMRESGKESLQALFSPLYLAHARYRAKLFPPPPVAPKAGDADDRSRSDKAPKGELPDPDWDAQWHAASAGLWKSIGITPLARVHEDLALEFVDPLRPAWDLRLSILARQAQRLARENRHDEALATILAAVDSREKRLDFGRREVRIWRDLVVGLEKDRAERRGDEAGARQLSVHESGDGAFSQAGLYVDVEDETESVYKLLTNSATSHHLAHQRLDETHRLASLIAIVQLRVSAAGDPAQVDAERGLQELERAWPGLLALDGGGDGRADGELMTRAREAKAKLEITACRAQDALLPPIIEELDAVAHSYERLSLPLLAARAYSLLGALCDHLAAGSEQSSAEPAAEASPPGDSSTAPARDAAVWTERAEGYERRSEALARELQSHRGLGQEGAETTRRWEELRPVVELVVEAVETSVQ